MQEQLPRHEEHEALYIFLRVLRGEKFFDLKK